MSYLHKQSAVSVLDTIGSSSFCTKLGLISKLFRTLTIEIGHMERKGSDRADVMESFGRVWARVSTLAVNENERFSILHGMLNELLKCWMWRMNIYYCIDKLLLFNVLNPSTRFHGLKTNAISPQSVFNTVELSGSVHLLPAYR